MQIALSYKHTYKPITYEKKVSSKSFILYLFLT